jgi:hypothetical protein
MKMPTKAQRAYIYSVVIALLPLLVAFGVMPARVLPLIAPLLLALLNVRDPEA